jgi:hypothetical protein
MKAKLLIIVLLLAVISTAGCGGGDDSASYGDGITITDFYSEFGEVDAGEVTMVALGFDNRGDYIAKDVSAILLRRGAFSDYGEPYDSNFEIEKPLNGAFSGDEFYWNLQAPDVSQDRTEEVQARITYDYETDAYATINLVPREILREQSEASFMLSPYSSNSPVSISIEANQPIVLRGDEKSKTVRANIVFQNTGGGEVSSKNFDNYDATQCTKAEDCIDEITIETIGGNCLGQRPATTTSQFCCFENLVYQWTNVCAAADRNDVSTCFEFSHKSCDSICSANFNGFDSSREVTHADSGVIYCECTFSEPFELSETMNGIKLIQGSSGRYTFTQDFIIPDTNAATSCQFHVNAKYTYEIDSPVLPIQIKVFE